MNGDDKDVEMVVSRPCYQRFVDTTKESCKSLYTYACTPETQKHMDPDTPLYSIVTNRNALIYTILILNAASFVVMYFVHWSKAGKKKSKTK